MNENTVTIPTEEYKSLIAARCFSNQFMNLLELKAKEDGSIYSSEVKTLCLLFGIAAEEELDA